VRLCDPADIGLTGSAATLVGCGVAHARDGIVISISALRDSLSLCDAHSSMSPCHCGLRFSRKNASPSLKSGVARMRAFSRIARSRSASTPAEDVAARGAELFEGQAKCASCHVSPLFTEPGWNMHTPEEIGIDDFQANRAPDKRYRTAPLKGLWTHTKGGFYHDGRFATLGDVVEHYNNFFALRLTDSQVHDLVEYLNSL
jgi:Cytochrome c